MIRPLHVLLVIAGLLSLAPAHDIWIQPHEIPLVIDTYARYKQNSSMFQWTPFDTTREYWDLTGFPGGLWTRSGMRAADAGRPGALDSMIEDPPSPDFCQFDTLGNNSVQWTYLYKTTFGLYVDGVDFSQGGYRFIGNYRPDYVVYNTPVYHTGSWNTAWQWRYELLPGVFIIFNEQHQKKIVSKGKVKVPMSGDYYWPCLVVRDYMVFTDNTGGEDRRWIYEWLVPGMFMGGNGVAAAMSQNGAAQNFINVEQMFQLSQLSVPGWDLTPPTFAQARVLPDTNFAGPYAVWANISDNNAVGAESLFYRVNQGSWTAKSADSSSSGRYYFTIPEVTMPAQVDYFYWAKDTFCVNQEIDLWTTWPVCAPESAAIRFTATSVGMSSGEGLQPGDLRFEVSPNPFRNSARFSLVRYATSRATVRVYNTDGSLVRTLKMTGASGPLFAEWDGRDEQGRRVPSGAYIYRVEAKDFARTGKLLFNR